MAKNMIQEGDILTLDPGATVASGDLIAVGTQPNMIAGVAGNSGVSGDNIPVYVDGVAELTKVTGAIAVGETVYMDNTGKVGRASTGLMIGDCVEAAASGDTSVKVKINEGTKEFRPRSVLFGQLDITGAASGTASVGAAYDGLAVKVHLQTNSGTVSVIKAAVASGVLTINLSGSATVKAIYEIVDYTVA